MELSEKTKIHVYGIFMILMSVSFLFIDNYSKHTIFRLDAHYSQTYLCAITK